MCAESVAVSSLGNTREPDKRIIILGGSGFIGSRLAGLLSDGGVPFQLGDLRKPACFPANAAECDIRDPESLSRLVRNAAAIVNLAAEHRDDVRPTSRYFETNVQGAMKVCDAARAEKVMKIVFTSSAAVYGFTTKPAVEEGPFHPFNPYGETKLQAEQVYQEWAHEDPSRSLVIVRPTVVFGEGNRGNVYNLLRQVESRRFLMVGRGENFKSMAYVGNVAAFLQHCLSMGPGVHIFNYADLPDISTAELIAYVLQCLGRPTHVRTIPKAAAMTLGYALDVVARITGKSFPISAIRVQKFCENTQMRADRVQQSGFVRPFTLQEGLKRTINSEFLKKSY